MNFELRQKRKYSLVKVFLKILLNMLTSLKNGLEEDLNKIKEGTYKNCFLLTTVSLALISWKFIYKFLALGEKTNFSFNAALDTLFFILTMLIFDILVNPFKVWKLLLRAYLIIAVMWNSIPILNTHINELRNSFKKSSKENIIKQRGNKL